MSKKVVKLATPKRAVRAAKLAGRGKYDAIRRELQRQRHTLLGEVNGTLTGRKELESYPDLTDQAAAEIDQNFTLRLKEREQKLLKKIDEALDRMASKTYGICEGCGQEIPLKRLKARPVTTFCIECKTLQEQEEKIRQ